MTLKQKIMEKLVECKRFVSFVINHFIEDDCSYRASALAFTSLLAIVPMMSVGFAILSSFPVFQDITTPAQDFIFENFVPATGKVVQNYLHLFETQVSKLPVIGLLFLFITAILLMYTIEHSMNKIWRVSTPRRALSAFFLYWTILSLAPLLLGLSLVASSYFFSMPFIRGYETPSLLLAYAPFILSFVGFVFLFVAVPNCPVRFMHGVYGALVATMLFELAKHAFAFYLTRSDTYQLLYGAFATIPIFFIWVYWVWFITLLGTEISYAFSVHYQRRQGAPLDGFSHALLWMYVLWLAQREGEGVSLETLINSSQQPFAVDIGDMLSKLVELQLIQRTTDGRYVLSRDLTHLSIYQLMQLLPYRLPNKDELVANKYPLKQWSEQIKKADSKLQGDLSISLEQFFQNEK